MRASLLLFTICLPVIFGGCAGLKPASFETGNTKLEPQKFFIGHTRSTGVIENRGGKPSARITTETHGILKDGVLNIEQDLKTEDGKSNHRSWQMRQIDAHHIEATSSDMVGKAHGVLYGNYFTWSFRLKLRPGKGLVKRVRMTQMMYVMPDGQTMIIRSVIRKAGIIVTEITEQFRKVE